MDSITEVLIWQVFHLGLNQFMNLFVFTNVAIAVWVGTDAYRRADNSVQHPVVYSVCGTVLAGFVFIPYYLAARKLQEDEERIADISHNYWHYLAIFYCLYMAIFGVFGGFNLAYGEAGTLLILKHWLVIGVLCFCAAGAPLMNWYYNLDEDKPVESGPTSWPKYLNPH